MCGRYSFWPDEGDERFSALIRMMDERYPDSYKTGEIFPGDQVPAIIQDQGRIVPVPAVFGLPGFEPGRRIINARSETAAQKPLFAPLLRHSRTVLPALGFYEWSRDPKKTKYFCALPGGEPMYLCGLIRQAEDSLCFVILTRPANASMSAVHHRMPVLVSAPEVRPYLTDDVAAARILAVSAPELELKAV